MTKLITLTQGRVAIVDDEDESLSEHRWCARRSARSKHGTYYALRCEGGRTVLMHRAILRAGPGQTVDHINGDGLDNRRENLRLVTHSQSMMNRVWDRTGRSSRFQGVTWDKKSKKWRAQIFINGRRIYLGVHSKEEDAASAYKKAAASLFGEFAPRLP